MHVHVHAPYDVHVNTPWQSTPVACGTFLVVSLAAMNPVSSVEWLGTCPCINKFTIVPVTFLRVVLILNFDRLTIVQGWFILSILRRKSQHMCDVHARLTTLYQNIDALSIAFRHRWNIAKIRAYTCTFILAYYLLLTIQCTPIAIKW